MYSLTEQYRSYKPYSIGHLLNSYCDSRDSFEMTTNHLHEVIWNKKNYEIKLCFPSRNKMSIILIGRASDLPDSAKGGRILPYPGLYSLYHHLFPKFCTK